MFQKLSRIYPPILELLPLFLLFLTFYLVFSNYSSLPSQIPTHFDFQGLPDDWGGKRTILLYPALGTFLYVLMTSVSAAMIVVKNPKALINLPESTKEKIPASQAELLRSFIVRCLFALKLITQVLTTYLAYANIMVAFGNISSIGYWPIFFLVAVLGTVGFMLFGISRLVLSK